MHPDKRLELIRAASIAAMQGILSNSEKDQLEPDEIASDAFNIALALVDRLEEARC